MTRRRCGGHSVIEVAFMAPWLFFLFVGTFDFGFYAYSLIATANAARIAALYTSSSDTAAADSTKACAIALNEMRGLPNLRAGAVCSPRLAGCKGPLCAEAVKGLGADGSAASKVTVRYETVALIPIPGVLDNMPLQHSVTMRVRSE